MNWNVGSSSQKSVRPLLIGTRGPKPTVTEAWRRWNQPWRASWVKKNETNLVGSAGCLKKDLWFYTTGVWSRKWLVVYKFRTFKNIKSRTRRFFIFFIFIVVLFCFKKYRQLYITKTVSNVNIGITQPYTPRTRQWGWNLTGYFMILVVNIIIFILPKI